MERVEGVIETAAGRRVGYLDRGPRDGRAVVYLHGAPGSRREQLLIPDTVLEQFHVRLVSVDRPGWGDTDAEAGDRVRRSADVLLLCDALGVGTFAVLAVSSGASYAVALAARAAPRVERLILASGQMPYDDVTTLQGLLPDQLALLPLLRAGRTDRLVGGIEQYRRRLLDDPMATLAPSLAGMSSRERRLLEQSWFRSTLVDEMRFGLHRSVDGLIDDLLTWPEPFEVDLADVRCPVLAIHGTDDEWEPIGNLLRHLPRFDDAQLLAVEGLNHLAPFVLPHTTMSLLMS